MRRLVLLLALEGSQQGHVFAKLELLLDLGVSAFRGLRPASFGPVLSLLEVVVGCHDAAVIIQVTCTLILHRHDLLLEAH